MTTNERKEAVVEWLKTVKVGDEVCVTNTYDHAARMLYGMFGVVNPNGTEEEVCIITTIRGILSDGCIVVDDKIYNPDGTTGATGLNAGMPSLHPVTDELRQLTWRYNFYKSIKSVQWESFSDDTLNTVIDIINKEINDIKERQEKEQQEKEEREAVARKEKEESAAMVRIVGEEDKVSSISLKESICRQTLQSDMSHIKCTDCPNRKGNDNGNES